MNFEGLSRNQKIRATLHRDVRAMCSETCHFLGLEITKPAMELISELVYKKLSVYGSDLEAFAKHAKRSTVTSEDVKLLVRKNPSLKSHLNSILPTSNSSTKEKRRKTVTPVRKQETPLKSKEDDKERVETEEFLKPEKPVLPDTHKAQKTDEFDEIMTVDVDDTIDLTFD